jgi:hypothetical protein
VIRSDHLITKQQQPCFIQGLRQCKQPASTCMHPTWSFRTTRCSSPCQTQPQRELHRNQKNAALAVAATQFAKQTAWAPVLSMRGAESLCCINGMNMHTISTSSQLHALRSVTMPCCIHNHSAPAAGFVSQMAPVTTLISVRIAKASLQHCRHLDYCISQALHCKTLHESACIC